MASGFALSRSDFAQGAGANPRADNDDTRAFLGRITAAWKGMHLFFLATDFSLHLSNVPPALHKPPPLVIHTRHVSLFIPDNTNCDHHALAHSAPQLRSNN
jgi:hypothetical protein